MCFRMGKEVSERETRVLSMGKCSLTPDIPLLAMYCSKRSKNKNWFCYKWSLSGSCWHGNFFCKLKLFPLTLLSQCHQSCCLVLIPFHLTVLIFLKLSAQNSLPPCGKYRSLHLAYIIKSKTKTFHFVIASFSLNKSNKWDLGCINYCLTSDGFRKSR